jgi:hypothetical protein
VQTSRGRGRAIERSILAAAFLLRLGYAATTGALHHPQRWEQEQIATNLIERHSFLFVTHSVVYRSYAEPLYPFMAAAVYLVTKHSFAALVLVQIVISTLTVAVVGWLTTKATEGRGAGSTATALTAIHPGLIYYSCVLHPLVLDAFFFAVCGALTVSFCQAPSRTRGLRAAAAIGLGTLTRPTMLLFLIPLCWLALRSTKRGALQALAFIATALAIVSPWTLRNAAIHHRFMLTRSGSGFVFWLGNNPNSSGSALTDDGRQVLALAPPPFLAAVRQANEVERDCLFRRAAWDYIRSDRAGAVKRVVRRLGDFWWFSRRWGQRFAPRVRLIYRAWWALLLACTIAGMYASKGMAAGSRNSLRLLLATALIVSFAQSLFYVEGRHRLAIEPLVIPAAAVGLVYAWRSAAAVRRAA